MQVPKRFIKKTLFLKKKFILLETCLLESKTVRSGSERFEKPLTEQCFVELK